MDYKTQSKIIKDIIKDYNGEYNKLYKKEVAYNGRK